VAPEVTWRRNPTGSPDVVRPVMDSLQPVISIPAAQISMLNRSTSDRVSSQLLRGKLGHVGQMQHTSDNFTRSGPTIDSAPQPHAEPRVPNLRESAISSAKCRSTLDHNGNISGPQPSVCSSSTLGFQTTFLGHESRSHCVDCASSNLEGKVLDIGAASEDKTSETSSQQGKVNTGLDPQSMVQHVQALLRGHLDARQNGDQTDPFPSVLSALDTSEQDNTVFPIESSSMDKDIVLQNEGIPSAFVPKEDSRPNIAYSYVNEDVQMAESTRQNDIMDTGSTQIDELPVTECSVPQDTDFKEVKMEVEETALKDMTSNSASPFSASPVPYAYSSLPASTALPPLNVRDVDPRISSFAHPACDSDDRRLTPLEDCTDVEESEVNLPGMTDEVPAGMDKHGLPNSGCKPRPPGARCVRFGCSNLLPPSSSFDRCDICRSYHHQWAPISRDGKREYDSAEPLELSKPKTAPDLGKESPSAHKH